MSRINWSQLLEHKGDALLTWLHECEEYSRRGIHGIWLFLVKEVPELFRRLLRWLYGQLFYACRVAVRVGRLLALVAAWLIIVFAPLVMYAGLVTGAWAAVAFAGSVYGLPRQFKNQSEAFN